MRQRVLFGTLRAGIQMYIRRPIDAVVVRLRIDICYADSGVFQILDRLQLFRQNLAELVACDELSAVVYHFPAFLDDVSWTPHRVAIIRRRGRSVGGLELRFARR